MSKAESALSTFEFLPRERYLEKYISQLIIHSVGVLVQSHQHPLLSILLLPIRCPQQLQVNVSHYSIIQMITAPLAHGDKVIVVYFARAEKSLIGLLSEIH